MISARYGLGGDGLIDVDELLGSFGLRAPVYTSTTKRGTKTMQTAQAPAPPFENITFDSPMASSGPVGHRATAYESGGKTHHRGLDADASARRKSAYENPRLSGRLEEEILPWEEQRDLEVTNVGSEEDGTVPPALELSVEDQTPAFVALDSSGPGRIEGGDGQASKYRTKVINKAKTGASDDDTRMLTLEQENSRYVGEMSVLCHATC